MRFWFFFSLVKLVLLILLFVRSRRNRQEQLSGQQRPQTYCLSITTHFIWFCLLTLEENICVSLFTSGSLQVCYLNRLFSLPYWQFVATKDGGWGGQWAYYHHQAAGLILSEIGCVEKSFLALNNWESFPPSHGNKGGDVFTRVLLFCWLVVLSAGLRKFDLHYNTSWFIYRKLK